MLTAIKLCSPATTEENAEFDRWEHYRLYTCMPTSNSAFHAFLQDTQDHRAHFNFSADVCSTSNEKLFQHVIQPLLDNLMLSSSSRYEQNEQLESSQNYLSSDVREDGRALQLTIIVDGSSRARENTLINSEDGVILLTVKHLLSLCQRERHATHSVHKESALNKSNKDKLSKHESLKERKHTVNSEYMENEVNVENDRVNVHRSSRLKEMESLCSIDGIYLSVYSLNSVTNTFDDALYGALDSTTNIVDTNSEKGESHTIKAHHVNACQGDNNVPITIVEDKEECFTSIEGGTCEFINDELMLPDMMKVIQSSFASARHQVFTLIATLHDTEMESEGTSTSTLEFCDNNTSGTNFNVSCADRSTTCTNYKQINYTTRNDDSNNSTVRSRNVKVRGAPVKNKRCIDIDKNEENEKVYSADLKENNNAWNITIQFVSLAVAEERASRHLCSNANDTCTVHKSHESKQHFDILSNKQENNINCHENNKISNNTKYKTEKSEQHLENVNANNLQSVRFSLNSAAMLLSCTASTNVVNFKSSDPLLFLLKPALLMTQPAMYISCFAPFAFMECNTELGIRKQQILSIVKHTEQNNLYIKKKSNHGANANKQNNKFTNHNCTSKNENQELHRSDAWECCDNGESFVTAFHVAQLAERMHNLRNAPWCSNLKNPCEITSNVIEREETEDNEAREHCSVPTSTSSNYVSSSDSNLPQEMQQQHTLHKNIAVPTIPTTLPSPQDANKEEKYVHKYNVHDENLDEEEQVNETSRKQWISNKVASNVGLVHTPACNAAKLQPFQGIQSTSHTQYKDHQYVEFTNNETNQHNNNDSKRNAMNEWENKRSELVCSDKVASNNECMGKMKTTTTTATIAATIPAMKVRENSVKLKKINELSTKNTQISIAHTKEPNSNEKNRVLSAHSCETQHDEVSRQDRKCLSHLLEMIDYQNSEIDEHVCAENELWQRCMRSENALKQSEQECARLRSELIELRHRYVYKEVRYSLESNTVRIPRHVKPKLLLTITSVLDI